MLLSREMAKEGAANKKMGKPNRFRPAKGKINSCMVKRFGLLDVLDAE